MDTSETTIDSQGNSHGTSKYANKSSKKISTKPQCRLKRGLNTASMDFGS
jgi:hypothetical protein